MKPKEIKPIFPINGDIANWRRQVKKLIETANPLTVQAVLVLLSQAEKDRQIRDLYRQIAAEGGK